MREGIQKAAVIGDPISHSLSPQIFSFVAKAREILGLEYSAIQVSPAEFSHFIENLRKDPEYIGLNVTIPHKESVLKLVDHVSPEAHAVGAANVVSLHPSKEGKYQLRGHNTDVLGILKTLENHGHLVQGSHAWIFGAGGAARAAAFALGSQEAERVFIQNRTVGRAEKVAQEMSAHFPKTEYIAVRDLNKTLKSLCQPISLLINSTSVGMKGVDPDPAVFSSLMDIPLGCKALAFDLIYHPMRTLFLQIVEQRKLKWVGGLEMLVHQALATWDIWFSSEVSFRQEKNRCLEQDLMKHLEGILRSQVVRDKPIFLTGFMGVGKTSVGEQIAQKMSWDFLDTDQMVMQKAGTSISHLFVEKGERYFRELERTAVEQASSMDRTVVALGGGALMDPENFNRVQSSGQLVYLAASSETLLHRLEATVVSRPLLSGLNSQERKAKVEILLEQRLPIYEKALIQILTDGRDPRTIAMEIVEKVNR